MYNIKLTDYVPEPKPVSTDYIVAAHYYAAWKKGAPGLHEGFDDLHGYPERTPLAGYYDEGNPEYADWEIKWALEHGINCFIHCWYRRLEDMGKPVDPAKLRCGHGLHEGFFNARYEKMMKFAIMFETSPRWGATDKDDMLENLMPFWMESYFKRGNYLIIDNKPVLFNFQFERMFTCFASPEEQRETFDKCREYCRAHGFDGMIFAAANWGLRKEKKDELVARGYDFDFIYNYGMHGEPNPPEDAIIAEMDEFFTKALAEDSSHHITTASCFSDPEPRTTERWKSLGYNFDRTRVWYTTPEGYRRVLANCRRLTDSLPESNVGRRIIMIDNWNEWDEGHFVAPSHKYGFGFLQAIREELTHRDNLPDYRMPQDLGLSRFNETWGEPDLGEICRERFNLK